MTFNKGKQELRTQKIADGDENYLGSFVLKNLKISHESGVFLIIAPNNVTMIKQRKYETIVNSQTGLEW